MFGEKLTLLLRTKRTLLKFFIMNKMKINAAIILIILVSISGKVVFSQQTVDKESCEKSSGYWYSEKCWQGFEDEGIPEKDIDRVVEKQLESIKNAKLAVNDRAYSIKSVDIDLDEKDGKQIGLFVVKTEDSKHNLLLMIDKKDFDREKRFALAGFLFSGEFSEKAIEKSAGGILTAERLKDDDFLISGTVSKQGDKEIRVKCDLNEAIIGAGSSKLEIKNGEAFLSGDLGTIAYKQIKDLIKDHPEVKVLTLTKISGSVNDVVNMHTGRLIRKAGLITKVTSKSRIYSGGVDLFVSGKKRIIQKGAKLGVHSWCCVAEKTAADLPKDHPAHQYQIAYFSEMLGAKGKDFYFYTLKAAPFDGVHVMKKKELIEWGIATRLVSKKSKTIWTNKIPQRSYFAKTVNPLSNDLPEYIVIAATNGGWLSDINVDIRIKKSKYKQGLKRLEKRIKNGGIVKTYTDLLNEMYEQGYEFVNAFPLKVESNGEYADSKVRHNLVFRKQK